MSQLQAALTVRGKGGIPRCGSIEKLTETAFWHGNGLKISRNEQKRPKNTRKSALTRARLKEIIRKLGQKKHELSSSIGNAKVVPAFEKQGVAELIDFLLQ